MTHKERLQAIAEFGHYMQRHAEYETALLYAIRDQKDDARNQAILKAQWAAKEVIFAAKRLGMFPDYVQSNVLDRANINGTDEA